MSATAVKIERRDAVLVVDLAVQGGAVTIPGTRIPASTIAGSVWAEGSVKRAREDYPGPSRIQVLTACVWYVGELECRTRPNKQERAILAAWGDWATRAHRLLAQRDERTERVPDPPAVVSLEGETE